MVTNIPLWDALGLLGKSSGKTKSFLGNIIGFISPLKKPIPKLSVADWGKIFSQFKKELPKRMKEKYPKMTEEEAQEATENCIYEFLGCLFGAQRNITSLRTFIVGDMKQEQSSDHSVDLNDEEVARVAKKIIDFYQKPPENISNEFQYSNVIEILKKVEEEIQKVEGLKITLDHLKSILKIELVMIALSETSLVVFDSRFGKVTMENLMFAGLASAMRSNIDQIFQKRPNVYNELRFDTRETTESGETFTIWDSVGSTITVSIAFKGEPNEKYKKNVETFVQELERIFQPMTENPLLQSTVESYEPADLLAEKILGLGFLSPLRYNKNMDKCPHPQISQLLQEKMETIGLYSGMMMIGIIKSKKAGQIIPDELQTEILRLVSVGAITSTKNIQLYPAFFPFSQVFDKEKQVRPAIEEVFKDLLQGFQDEKQRNSIQDDLENAFMAIGDCTLIEINNSWQIKDEDILTDLIRKITTKYPSLSILNPQQLTKKLIERFKQFLETLTNAKARLTKKDLEWLKNWLKTQETTEKKVMEEGLIVAIEVGRKITPDVENQLGEVFATISAIRKLEPEEFPQYAIEAYHKIIETRRVAWKELKKNIPIKLILSGPVTMCFQLGQLIMLNHFNIELYQWIDGMYVKIPNLES